MTRIFTCLLGVAALTVTAQHATAGDWPVLRSIFGSGNYTPSNYGYNLDEVSAGYYGGGRYREYYNYGRGYGIANYPGPLPGKGVPPDYRGSVKHDHFGYTPPAIQSAASPLLQGNTVAHITVEVPAGAEIWFEGHKTQQDGTTRRFVSPPIGKGDQYKYTVRARWNEDGKPIDQSKQVAVSAGDQVTVSFPTGEKKEVTAAPKPFPLGDER